MVCYLPGTGTFAVIGFAVYLVWHRAITHFLAVAGTAAEIALLLGAEAAVAIALIWTARMIRRRRARAGACTTCRFRCQEALQGRPNLLINRVDRRVTPPLPVRPATRTCHPAAPHLGTPRHPARPASASRPAPVSRPASASRPAPIPRPAPASRPAPIPPPAPASRPAPAPRPAVPAGERWPVAPRHTVRDPVPSSAGSRESVAFDRYVLTPDGVDGQPAPAIEH
jgi:hypothetical protein